MLITDIQSKTKNYSLKWTLCYCRAARYIHRSRLFLILFLPCHSKRSDCQWTHGSFFWKRTVKHPEKHTSISRMHSFMNPTFWTVDHHNIKTNKWQSCTVFTPGCSCLSHSSKHSHYPLSEKCEALLPSKKQKVIRDACKFLFWGQHCVCCRLSKRLSFSF